MPVSTVCDGFILREGTKLGTVRLYVCSASLHKGTDGKERELCVPP
jgi:hypothetical protein